MELSGIPLHPLIVHAAVVFGPLAALTACAFALLPRYRWLMRWPLALLLALSLISMFLATFTGDSLLQSRPGLRDLAPVQSHQQLGARARNVMIALAFVGAIAVWRLPGASPLKPLDPPRADGLGERLIVAGTILLAVVVGVTVVMAGHSGARAVWG